MTKIVNNSRYSFETNSQNYLMGGQTDIFLSTGSMTHPKISNFKGSHPKLAYRYQSGFAGGTFIAFADDVKTAKENCANAESYGESYPDKFLGVVAELKTAKDVENFINSIAWDK
jgi:hypothetical protein